MSAIQPSARLVAAARLAIWASLALRSLSGSGAEVDAVGDQQVEGHVRRTVIPEQEFVEQGAAGAVKHDELAVEDEVRGE